MGRVTGGSMKNEFKADAECMLCSGTGIYVGMGERDGFGVVCRTCKGTGCQKLTMSWKDFDERKVRTDVARVLQANPGIIVGTSSDSGLTIDSFGGIPYEEWLAGKMFERGTEDRAHTCPAWFYQSTDYSKKPDWKECEGGGPFSRCQHFGNKAECWKRFDNE